MQNSAYGIRISQFFKHFKAPAHQQGLFFYKKMAISAHSMAFRTFLLNPQEDLIKERLLLSNSIWLLSKAITFLTKTITILTKALQHLAKPIPLLTKCLTILVKVLSFLSKAVGDLIKALEDLVKTFERLKFT
jgi:hypothetical protein